MKKSLFAFAAVTAFAGAAQAQSSVTVYGILDVGFINSGSSVTNAPQAGTAGAATINYPAVAAAYANGQIKSTQAVFGQSAEQTSRLGFKGNEDLGGGTSAFFTAEFTLAPNEQTLSGNTAGGLKNRQAFVGLKKAGWGDFAIGTQYTPLHIAVGKTDPGQQNNMTGSVIYTGQADSNVVGGAVGGNQNAYTSRQSNSLTLNSDVYSGFQAHGMLIANNTNASEINATSPTAGGNTNQNGWALAADYTFNKFFATAAYTAIKNNNTTAMAPYTGGANAVAAVSGTAANTTTAGAIVSPQVCNAAGLLGPSGTVSATTGNANGLSTTNQCFNIQDNQGYVGATYDFGILKAYASWITRKASDSQNSGIYQKRQAEQIGVRSFVTPTVEAWASAGVGTFTPMGYNQNSAHFNAWQLGSNYWLSKRTNLYAIYGQYAQANTLVAATYNANGTVASSQMTSVNANNIALGVRHTF